MSIIPNIQNKTVLLVDDEQFSRVTVLRLLKNLGNPEALSAENGNDALDVLRQRHHLIECVIADFNMPVMHGLQLLKRIRCGEHGIRRNMPVIMLTGHSETVLVKLAIDMDVSSFIVKPVTKDNLVPRLTKAFEQDISDESWLKPISQYQTTDVDSSIMDILEKNAASQIKEKPQKTDSDAGDGIYVTVDSLVSGLTLVKAVIGFNEQVYVNPSTELTDRIIQNLVDLVAAEMIENKFIVD